jgi:hypothetical protein
MCDLPVYVGCNDLAPITASQQEVEFCAHEDVVVRASMLHSGNDPDRAGDPSRRTHARGFALQLARASR